MTKKRRWRRHRGMLLPRREIRALLYPRRVAMDGDEIVHLNLPGTLKHLNVLSACIEAMLERENGIKDRDDVCHAIEIAAHEICTNVVRHAYAAPSAGRQPRAWGTTRQG